GADAPPKIYRARVEPHWFSNDSKFWYRNELPGGAQEFILVDAEKGTRAPAFDHDRLATSLSTLLGKKATATHLPVEGLEYRSEGAVLLLGLTNGWNLKLD